jgi:histone-lysine N-methyltransferase SETD1
LKDNGKHINQSFGPATATGGTPNVKPTNDGLLLRAIDSKGKIWGVKIKMNGRHFKSSDARNRMQHGSAKLNGAINVQHPLGEDGNLYFCDYCHEMGDVVCCDRCPRVYHPTCIPKNSESRMSLDADEDPWYCPTCLKETKLCRGKIKTEKLSQRNASPNGNSDQHRTTRSKTMCVECHKSSGGPMGECQNCHATIHVPSCRGTFADMYTPERTCSTCLAKSVLDGEEEERKIAGITSKKKSKKMKSKEQDQIVKQYCSDSSSDMTPPPPPPNYGGRVNGQLLPSLSTNHDDKHMSNGRKRPIESSIPTSHHEEQPQKKTRQEQDERNQSIYRSPTSQNFSPTKRNLPERATPSFYFFLLENKIRLERQLARKNRSFKRLKGYPRNYLIAKEGALLWRKMTKLERKRFLDMSIEEFEYNVLSWKEDETLREMLEAEGNQNQEKALPEVDGNINEELIQNEDLHWSKKFQDLIAPSQVSCRKMKNNSESIQNGVLLELLQDTRFHSLPMMKPNREKEFESPDYSSTAVPHFDIQGPISTGIGDGCLGCIRGWNHFCPILKRQFPAVENRAKLQPPCPSHLPTRIGIGLPQYNYDDEKLSFCDKKVYRDLRFLSAPNTRSDEIMKLIESAMAVKLPSSKTSSKDVQSHSKKKSSTKHGKDLYECGRCKTSTNSSTGCVTCRRVKLLVDMSKKTPGQFENLTIKTVMLGRAATKTDEFHAQTKGERIISRGLVKRHWKPNAILPNTKKCIPPKYSPIDEEESSSEDETSSVSTSSSSEIDDNEGTEEEQVDERRSNENVAEGSVSPAFDNEPVPKKRRLTRSTISTNTEVTSHIESSRQTLAQEHKEEADNLNSRCLSIATYGILLAMMRRDPLRLFAEPVLASVEGYHKIIKNPMDLSTMKSKVLDNQYHKLGAFMSDARLLCINSLVYNPPGSIYSTTAEEIQGVLGKMQKHAGKWMSAIKNAHASYYAYYQSQQKVGRKRNLSFLDENNGYGYLQVGPFEELRKTWPSAVELLEDDGKCLRAQVEAEFIRTRENECAYYSALAVRRAAKAADASLAPIFDNDGVFTPCVRRTHIDDENLRAYISRKVAEGSDPAQITTPPSWREQDVLEFLKKVQKRRVEMKISPENGCARCDKIAVDDEANKLARETSVIRRRKKNDGVQVRIAQSRLKQSNGMASKRERDRVLNSQKDSIKSIEAKSASARDRSVTVRGSGIQGWGLFADHPFKKGELVAEYVGEYVVNPMADKREKFYEERRIQDYQFRVSSDFVIDATKLGGHARYINHSCDPSCVAKIIDGDPPFKHLKRVVVISQRDIQAGEEITYDYQFPLELDLDARIPCNCGCKNCRGFMNWDLPESGSLVSKASTRQGRRDRIRRLVNKAL